MYFSANKAKSWLFTLSDALLVIVTYPQAVTVVVRVRVIDRVIVNVVVTPDLSIGYGWAIYNLWIGYILEREWANVGYKLHARVVLLKLNDEGFGGAEGL